MRSPNTPLGGSAAGPGPASTDAVLLVPGIPQTDAAQAGGNQAAGAALTEWAVLAFLRECHDGDVPPEFLVDAERAADLYAQMHVTAPASCDHKPSPVRCRCWHAFLERQRLEREASRLRAAVVARALR